MEVNDFVQIRKQKVFLIANDNQISISQYPYAPSAKIQTLLGYVEVMDISEAKSLIDSLTVADLCNGTNGFKKISHSTIGYYVKSKKDPKADVECPNLITDTEPVE